MPDEAFQGQEKSNYNTKDYTLEQFHRYIAKKIDETNYHDDVYN